MTIVVERSWHCRSIHWLVSVHPRCRGSERVPCEGCEDSCMAKWESVSHPWPFDTWWKRQSLLHASWSTAKLPNTSAMVNLSKARQYARQTCPRHLGPTPPPSGWRCKAWFHNTGLCISTAPRYPSTRPKEVNRIRKSAPIHTNTMIFGVQAS